MSTGNDDDESGEIILVPGGTLAPPGGPPERNPALQYLMSLRTVASRRTMKGVLDRAARIFAQLDGAAPVGALSYPWAQPGALSFAKVQAAVSVLDQEGKTTTARLACSALRGVARFAFNLGLLDVAERQRIDDVRPPRLERDPKEAGRRLSEEEIARLYAACAADASPAGRRDAALLALAIGAGPRRFEISALDLADYERPARLGRDPVEIKVRGKGRKRGVLVAPPDVGEAIEDWLRVRGRDPGPLFWRSPGRGRGLEPGSRLSAAGVYDVIVRRAREAKIHPEIAPHDLRRTAITMFLENVGDLALAQSFARHASPTTTARYDRRAHDALRKAVAGARVGYVGE